MNGWRMMNKKNIEEVKLHNKDFEDMELEELYAERSSRTWHRGQMKHCVERLKKRQWWLEENMPIYSKEEINQQYENGEMTYNQYKTAFARRKRAINQRMKNDDRMLYGERVAYHEEAMVAYIDELIAKKLAEENVPYDITQALQKHDPRKRSSKYNRRKSDPKRSWNKRQDALKEQFPALKGARRRWKRGQKAEQLTMTVMRRMQPILTWDMAKLMQVAGDRGYFTELAVTAAVSEALNISIGGADKLLQSGKMSWGQCMVIGAVFEMTPKEFCDVFMSGYFVEVADGVFRAQVDDIDNLLDAPYRAKPMITEEGNDEVGI